MEENYIRIFSLYLSELLKSKQFDFNDAWYMAEQFKPMCDKIKSRKDLLDFLGPYLADYPEFGKLKSQLENSAHTF